MDRVTFGRTGLEVSAAGLGCGGASRLGQAKGASEVDSIALVRAALDLGVNLIDTAAGYRTEAIVGKAIRGRREQVILSTKAAIIRDPEGREMVSGEDFGRAIDASLRRLDTDHIDIFSAHAVRPGQLGHVREEIIPALLRARDAGKIRFLGITEQFGGDPGHEMMRQALDDGVWDMAMIGFNLLNPSARDRVLPSAARHGTALVAMFAVRRALSSPSGLAAALVAAAAAGQIDPSVAGSPEKALAFLKDGSGNLVEAGYRFCRHEPGIHSVLTGTGSIDHLRSNLRALAQPPLPAPALARLADMFGRVDCISGD